MYDVQCIKASICETPCTHRKIHHVDVFDRCTSWEKCFELDQPETKVRCVKVPSGKDGVHEK